jgi:hypothetical protein
MYKRRTPRYSAEILQMNLRYVNALTDVLETVECKLDWLGRSSLDYKLTVEGKAVFSVRNDNIYYTQDLQEIVKNITDEMEGKKSHPFY